MVNASAMLDGKVVKGEHDLIDISPPFVFLRQAATLGLKDATDQYRKRDGRRGSVSMPYVRESEL